MLANSHPKRQAGVFLLEALIGLIIFAVGALAMIAMQASAISAQSDSQYRIEAANLVDQLMGQLSLNVDRTSATTVQTSMAAFAHQATGTIDGCNYSGATSSHAAVTGWVSSVTATTGGLPGTTASMIQILVDTATYNRVTISVCWQPVANGPKRRHTVISHIN